MTIKVSSKVNAKLKFICGQNKYLTPRLKRLLGKTLIQPYFITDVQNGSSLFNKNLKHQSQAAQNKYIRLSLDLTPHSHVDVTHLRKLDWLPIS